MAFKRVVRKKKKETKVEDKRQLVRNVTFKIPAQKQALKSTPKATSSIAKRNKKSDIDLAIQSANVTIIPPKTCAKLVDEITKDGRLKNV